jgi:hypothetical protein
MHNKLYKNSFSTFINLVHKGNYTQIHMCDMHKDCYTKLSLTSALHVLACPYMLNIPHACCCMPIHAAPSTKSYNKYL